MIRLYKYFLLIFVISFISCKGTNLDDKMFVTLETLKGKIKMKLRPDKAPETCKRIRELVDTGFYDNLTFHRVEPGFVIQTGDPEGTGAGGYGKNLNAEFNDLKHTKGAVGMARKANDINSASSQFYITLDKYPHLDGQYTVFAYVVEGMDVALKIVEGDKIIKMKLE